MASILALLQNRAPRNVDIEQVEFLVFLGDAAPLVNPQERVLCLGRRIARFVDAHVYGQR